MKRVVEFVRTTVVGGLLVIVPVAITVAVFARLLAAMNSLLQPIARHLPPWLPFGGDIVALLLLVMVCFVAGAVARTQIGNRIIARGSAFLERVPGFTLFRAIARQVAGEQDGDQFDVALVEIEEGLCPAFLVEQHDDGRWTVFVPAIPTPTVGAVYIFPPEKVHRVDVPFTTAVKCITRWGTGSRELLSNMRPAR